MTNSGITLAETARPVDEAAARYSQTRAEFWNAEARKSGREDKLLHRAYKEYLRKLYRFMVPEGLRVLEVGCAEGDLLAALKPSCGVGVDFAANMLEEARKRHSELHFVECDVLALEKELAGEYLSEPFDVIILSDFVNDAWDMLEVFKKLKPFCNTETRMIINYHSHLWEHPFKLLQKFEKVNPHLAQNWFTKEDIANLLNLAGFKLVTEQDDYLCPFPVPLLAPFCNRVMAKIWPFSLLDIFHVQVARLKPEARDLSVSIVIPARNEAGNIEAALQRTPDMGKWTEIIFVEGNSTDNTWQTIQEMAEKYAEKRKIKTMRQPGKGKGDAVRTGFDAAEGDILMILDADLTMPPESLPQFYEAIASGQGEFINGVRLVYPQEKEAMRFFNLLGNKFFSWAFSWLLGRPVKDTLCGTKVLTRENYKKLAANRAYFGNFDPFGDFDLLFGAAKLNLDIIDLPVRYRERTYGDTNISRWRDGWILLKMVCFAAKRIKFVP